MLLITFLASLAATAVARHYLLKFRILDIPNARSSHSIATARGGGIGIVLVFLLTILWLRQRDSIPGPIAWALTGGGLLVAGVGLLDDHFNLSARTRLLAHFFAAGFALWQIGGMTQVSFGPIVWQAGWVGNLLAATALVWMINLYNFMDGIDGLAGAEAVCVSLAACRILAGSGLSGLSGAALALAGSSGGFLLWNWPRALVFMGDAGSGFLGFVFGLLAVASAKERPLMLWPWVVLLAVFLTDTTLTLLRRILTTPDWGRAHRSHAYQHVAIRWRSHGKVTLSVAAINIVWLLPLAWAASIWPAVGPLFAALAAVPLIFIEFRFAAGLDTARAAGCPKPGIPEQLKKEVDRVFSS